MEYLYKVCNVYEGSDDDAESLSSADELDSQGLKRRKLSQEERLERNRIHARNTRERKKCQMESLQIRIRELVEERNTLKSAVIESSMAGILMSIAGVVPIQEVSSAACEDDLDTRNDVNKTLEKLKMHVSAQVSDDEDLDADQAVRIKEKSPTATAAELKKIIRRERNRMHAKKARLRKKKMIEEMESVVHEIESEIADLKRKYSTSKSLMGVKGSSEGCFQRQPYPQALAFPSPPCQYPTAYPQFTPMSYPNAPILNV